jgi:glutamyl-tRNA synthetase
MYDYFEWSSTMPQFAHLPLILKPEGAGKLSKRDGDKHGFPVFPLVWTDPFSGDSSNGFRESGYLPEALINFLALLGWNPGTEQELFNIEGLIKLFSLDRVNKSGAKFDIEKAKWINQQYLKDAPISVLGEYLNKDLNKHGISVEGQYVDRVADAFRERITLLTDLYPKTIYFFKKPVQYDDHVIKKKWTIEAVEVISAYSDRLKKHDEAIDHETAKKLLIEIIDKKNIGMGIVMQALRVAITGVPGGIDLMQTIEILGAHEVAERIDRAVIELSERIKE